MAGVRPGSCPPNDPDHWQPCAVCGAPLSWDMSRCTSCDVVPDLPRPWLYASRTGTHRNLREMARHGYRLLATPQQLAVYRSHPEPPWAYCLDNGAWTAHKQELAFDGELFHRAVDTWGEAADWIAVPDIVMGGLESLALSLRWLPRLRGHRLLLIPVQDGMVEDNLRAHLGADVGLFVGGSTVWKEQTMSRWAALARECGAWCHVGRVNTNRRLAMVVECGADSCDGTSATKYAVKAGPLARAARQGALFLGRVV